MDNARSGLDTAGAGWAVEVRGLTKRYGDRTVVDDVDLRVRRGSAFGYLGPNGAGKTTLIRMLLGLTSATEGSMAVLGHPVPAERARALARVGAIVEEPKFHGYLSGRRSLTVLAAAREPAAAARIGPALERVGLAERADDRVADYSMGMRQRLGVAACLLSDPELLLLDEPMNGLDPAGMLEFRELIREFVAEGRTVILSSHLLDEIQRTCDAAAVVDHGRIVAQGSIAELTGTGRGVVVIGCADPARASAIALVHGAVGGVREDGAGITVTLRPAMVGETRQAAADLNRVLVDSGIDVFGVEIPRPSLEERFLEITTTTGGRS